MKFTQLIRVGLAVAFTVVSTSAGAQWAVYDPANWIQNMTSARTAIMNEVNTAKALIQQINAAKDLARSTSSLKNLSGLAGIDEARQLYGTLAELDIRLNANLEDNLRMALDLRAQHGASNMSWQQFTAAQAKMDSGRQRAAREHYAAMTRSMEDTARKRQAIVSQLSGVEGQTQAMQALGAALDVIIGQNQQVMAQMRVDKVIEKDIDNKDEAKQIWAENQRALYQKRLREAANQF